MSEQSFDDKYFDSLLNQALQDVEAEEIKRSEAIYLEFKDKPAFKTSLRHKWRMKKLIKSLNKEQTGEKHPQLTKQVFVTALVAIIIISSVIFASADISKLFKWLGFYTEEYIDISSSRDYTQKMLEETKSWEHGKVYVPGLIPKGYELIKTNVSTISMTLTYLDMDNNYIKFSVNLLGSETISSVDNEGASVHRFEINGFDAIYSENDDTNMLIYCTNEYYFRIVSNALNKKDLQKILENLEDLEKIVVN